MIKLKKLRLKSIKNRSSLTKKYIRFGYYDIDSVMNTLIKNSKSNNPLHLHNDEDNVVFKTTTNKCNIFKRNYISNKSEYCSCQICGIKATYFVLEKDPVVISNMYHLNLYTVRPHNNQELYFNIDHIIPRSKGGNNHSTNMQLTCEDCNTEKGNTLAILELNTDILWIFKESILVLYKNMLRII